jgi:TonB-linked SusC/RagA family outer membrane protein
LPRNIGYEIKDNKIYIFDLPAKKEASVSQQNSQQNQVQIRGKVTDVNGEPIIGATILIKGTGQGTVTDMDGNYTLQNVPEDAILQFSYVGMETQEIPVSGKTIINVLMKEAAELLEEVVVVGYGTQKKANLTGAVSAVKMDEVLGDRPVPTAGNLLQGTIPGLQVTSGTGEPGGGTSFNIRGTTSINGGSPLILVDNVPFTGPLNLINPNDIETVTVLKDASSASIYGARSAFGVILITTKGAKKNQKIQMNYNNNFSFTVPSELPRKANPLQTVQAYKDMGYITYYTGHNVDTWIELLKEYNKDPSVYPLGYIIHDGMRYQLKENDLIKDFLGETGFQQQHNFSVNGGNEITSFRVSLGYTNSDGVITTSKDNYTRYNAKGFIDTKITDWLAGQLDLSYYKSDKSLPSGADYNRAVWDPSYTPTGMIEINGENLWAGTAGNLTRLGAKNLTEINDTRTFIKLIITPIDNMVINSEFTYDHLDQTNTNYNKRLHYANAAKFTEEYSAEFSTYSRTRAITNYIALNLYGSYAKSFLKNNFTLLLGYNQESRHYDYLQVTTDQMINDELPSISQSVGTQKAYDGFDEYSVQGLFGRFNYDYASKYLFEINGRYDGSSKFPPHNRWGFFPSISLGWRIVEESFMEPFRNFIPELKLRASFGKVGNQSISSYAFVPAMDSYKSTWLVNNIQPITLNMPGLVSSNFTWETVQTLNFGVDLGLFKNRLFANFDYFIRKTLNMLSAGIELPAVLGTSAPLQNVADLKSQGFEIEVNWRDQIGNVRYNIGCNLYDYKAHITRFNNEAGLLSTYYVGQRIGEIWGYVTDRLYTIDDFVEGSLDANLRNGKLKEGIPHVEGISPNPGDVLYKDFNSDGIINAGQSTLSDPGDRKIIGNNTLRYQFGVNGGIAWKNFDFAFFLQGVAKNDRWLSNDLIFPYYYEFGTIYSHELNYWSQTNPNSYFPRLYQTGTRDARYAANVRTQTKFLTNGAYLRVKNLSLAYNVPHSFIAKAGINNLRIIFSVENPFNFDHMPRGLDPTITGVERTLGYPIMRFYSIGFNLSL